MMIILIIFCIQILFIFLNTFFSPSLIDKMINNEMQNQTCKNVVSKGTKEKLVRHTPKETHRTKTYRSGEIFLKNSLFCGTDCKRNETVKTNCPTVEINPPKKALKGKFPTNITKTN